MSSPDENVHSPSTPSPTLNRTASSTTDSTSSPTSYVSLLDSCETPGEICSLLM